MTPPTTAPDREGLLPVEQADRRAAADWFKDQGYWHVDPQPFLVGEEDGSVLVQAFARRRASPPSVPGEVEGLRAKIAEARQESDGNGHWRACSGCQESDEGCVSEKYYPYSTLFECQPGAGCTECGGLGVVWENENWSDFAEWSQQKDRDRENVRSILWKHLGGDDRYGAIAAAVDEIDALTTTAAPVNETPESLHVAGDVASRAREIAATILEGPPWHHDRIAALVRDGRDDDNQLVQAAQAGIEAALQSPPTREGFSPCPTCHQYSHSIGADRIAEAFNHFQSMFAHPVRGHPMGHHFDEKTRDAAQVLMALRARAQVPPNADEGKEG